MVTFLEIFLNFRWEYYKPYNSSCCLSKCYEILYRNRRCKYQINIHCLIQKSHFKLILHVMNTCFPLKKSSNEKCFINYQFYAEICRNFSNGFKVIRSGNNYLESLGRPRSNKMSIVSKVLSNRKWNENFFTKF